MKSSVTPTMICGELRLSRSLLQRAWDDLDRPHEFAAERVGFLFGRYYQSGEHEPMVLLYDYQTVPDEGYLPSDEFGALIGRDVIRSVRQRLLDKQGTGESAFHVHIHEHDGQPGLSGPDRSSLPELIPGFQRVEPAGGHGILVLSRNHGVAWVWLPGEGIPFVARAVVVSGAPLGVFRYQERVKGWQTTVMPASRF